MIRRLKAGWVAHLPIDYSVYRHRAATSRLAVVQRQALIAVITPESSDPTAGCTWRTSPTVFRTVARGGLMKLHPWVPERVGDDPPWILQEPLLEPWGIRRQASVLATHNIRQKEAPSRMR